MRELTEKEAENFLEKNGMNVVERITLSDKKNFKNIKFKFPWVMKLSSKKLMHKAKVGGVKTNINSIESAENQFNIFSKMNGFEEVMIQKQIVGKEIVLGIKNTPEFGHVIMFGKGGSKVEEDKDVAFRAIPIKNKELDSLIKDTKISKTLSSGEVKNIIRATNHLQSIVKKYPKIKELDINPLMINEKNYTIADARIVME